MKEILSKNEILDILNVLYGYASNDEVKNHYLLWFGENLLDVSEEQLIDLMEKREKETTPVSARLSFAKSFVPDENATWRFLAQNIHWDTDGEDIGLPSEMLIPEDIAEDRIGDYLSDATGFCHYGFSLLRLPMKEEGGLALKEE